MGNCGSGQWDEAKITALLPLKFKLEAFPTQVAGTLTESEAAWMGIAGLPLGTVRQMGLHLTREMSELTPSPALTAWSKPAASEVSPVRGTVSSHPLQLH